MGKSTFIRIIASGSYIEVYHYKDKPLLYGFTIPENKRKKEKIVVVDEESKQRKIDSRMRSMFRAGAKLRRLINANVWRWNKSSGKPYPPVFATFTFKADVRDIKTANKIFSRFIKRLNYAVTDGTKETRLKYVVVTEFQDLKRKGVVHFHTIFFNLKYVWGDDLAKIWDQGNVDIKAVKKIKNIGGYVSKYMSKNFEDERLDGYKRYFSSRGLYKPAIIRDPAVAFRILRKLPQKCFVRKKDLTSEYQGKYLRSEYKLDRLQTLFDYELDLERYVEY